MGWFKENFPGSPAQRQRTLVCRVGVGYAVVASVLFYLYSPLAKRTRKELAEGKVPYESIYFQQRRKDFEFFGPTIHPISDRETFMEAISSKEQLERQDFMGPEASEDTIRSMVQQRRK